MTRPPFLLPLPLMLSELQRQKLPNLFRLHDIDGDGAIRRNDFEGIAGQIARARGLAEGSPEERELASRFDRMWGSMSDLATDGAITLDAWLAHWDRALDSDDTYDEFARPIGEFVFLLLDLNGDGSVAESEFLQFYQIMGLDDAQARRVFNQIDLDGSGSLSRDEIGGMIREYFLSDDPDAPGNVFFGPIEVAA